MDHNSQDEIENVEDTRGIEIDSLIKGTFGTDIGRKCLEHLKKIFVDRAIARDGDDILSIGIRQGEANVINKIIKEVNHG